MKKICSILLALLLVLGMIPSPAVWGGGGSP